MCSLPAENWLRLGLWFLLGMAIYVFYGRRHSVLRREKSDAEISPTEGKLDSAAV